ncbi:MAG: MEKHLA domain-containing protein [Thermosynechococcaceae cyanobacterium]
MISAFPEPSHQNGYLAQHIDVLCKSFKRLIGHDLTLNSDSYEAAKEIFEAPFVVVSHNTADDPIFNYGNQTALSLFEMTWSEFTTLPSRLSAEEPNREARSQLLAAVSAYGFMQNYSGLRISKSGKRFWIEQVTVWNVLDGDRRYYGQAALYSNWRYV